MTAAVLLGVGVLLLYVVFNHSARESRYRCFGTFSEQVGDTSTFVFRLAEYRWWVGLWSDSDGELSGEIPNRLFVYFPELEVGSNAVRILRNDDVAGLFSPLSGSLMLHMPPSVYSGQCEPIR